MPKVVEIKSVGGTEVMDFVEHDLDLNGPSENHIRIKQTAIGVNYIDTYHRSGIYPVSLPCVLGIEAVGEIVSMGSGVSDLRVGQRVGYASAPIGAYAEERDFPADKVVNIPDSISDTEAASVLLKGMTVEYLFNRTHKIKKGEFFLFHAAAGGVGLLACQWSRAIGAKMIGTVSNREKADLARNEGCDFVLNYKEDNIVKSVMEITNGRGVSVAYDGVGIETFQKTIDCLAERGLFVSFGQSSGMIGPVELHGSFAPKNLFYTRPSLLVYNKTKKELDNSSKLLFKLIGDKKIKLSNITKYKLENAGQAHEDLQSRKTTGSLVLIP